MGFSNCDLRYIPVLNGNCHDTSQAISRVSHTPHPNPQRDPIPPIALPTRMEDDSTPRSRRPALERLSLSKATALQRLGEHINTDSGQLQDIVVQYEAETEDNPAENRISALR
ncbi:unnamed protein product [Arabis nemorensis]|uniref:Uncharacterized protein n=1 Tax=Arabis nemorensis TaxID=586526 RepID=A0A565BP56_9BRAS|nr:unnamed protein product [Arabis nemorensis]